MASTTRSLRVMTWNINGLRAVLQREKTRLQALLRDFDADIVCFQETKLTRSELDDELVRPDGYDAFYSFCRVRSGYSGVVTFVKSDIPTVRAEEGLTGAWTTETPVGHIGDIPRELGDRKLLHELEAEGRCVITDHDAFVLLNVYCPAIRNSERLEYKLAFHELLHDRVRALQRAGKRVIVVGDINIAHREIDHCDPSGGGSDDRAFSDHPCRQWMDALLLDVDVLANAALDQQQQQHTSGRLVDAFRFFHPLEARAYTCWNTKTGARQTNFGTRIDYVLVDPVLMRDAATDCIIQPDRMGSDHCPVLLSATVQLRASARGNNATAALCAKNFVEFAGKQQGIKTFLTGERLDAAKHDALPTTIATATTATTRTNDLGRRATSSTPSPGARKRRISTSGSSSSSRPNQASITSFFSQRSTTTAAVAAVATTTTVASRSVRSDDRSATTQQLTPKPTSTTAEDDDIDIPKLMRAFEAKEQAAATWREVLSGAPRKTPLCHCQQPTVLRTVLKTNDNWGRKFFVCTKPEGERGHPDARCEFFQWLDDRSSSSNSNSSKRAKSVAS